MQSIVNVLPIIQIVTAILLVAGILLQRSEESLGGAFGGSDSVDTTQNTRRGADKFVFKATIVMAVIFVIASIAVFLTK
jgi:protein translocase SecG subunit